MSRVVKLLIFCIGTFGAVTVCAPQARAQWTIGTLLCTQVSTSFGDTSAVCSGFSKTEFRDTITFYASALCEDACDNAPISTSVTLNIGVSEPCSNAVSYTFWGGTASGSLPYVYVNNYAQDAIVPQVDQSSSKDCNGTPAYAGPGPTFPC
jgi:hypothetical protein